jgi:hypothetical protein
MKALRNVSVLCSLALLGAGCGSGSDMDGNGNDPPGGTKKWTVLVYMMADNNLEPSGIDDLNEMMAGGSTADVNIVVEADRHAGYSKDPVGGLADWEGTKRLLVQKGKLDEIADLGETDQAQPAALAAFIEWGVKAYPAERHALVMWNHGMAWPGFGHDEKTNTHMTLPQLAQGITDGLGKAGIASLDLLGFDACLMANLAVAHELAGVAPYLVASEETEPGHGWDYAAITGFLAGQPAADGLALGKAIVDSFPPHAQAKNAQSARTITLSLLETAKVQGLVQAVEDLAATLTPGVQSRAEWLPVAISRGRTEEYGRTGDAQSASNVVDINHLVQQLSFYGVQGADDKLKAVESALKETVVHSIKSELHPNASGVTLFFPTPQLYSQRAQSYGQTAFGKGRWNDLLAAYAATAQSDKTAPTLSQLDYTADQIGLQAFSTLSGQTDDVAEAYFLLATSLGDAIQLMSAVPVLPDTSGELGVDWDYMLPTVSDGATTRFATMVVDFSNVWDVTEGKRDLVVGEIPMQVQAPDQSWYSGFIRVGIKLKGGATSVLGTFVVTPGGMSEVKAAKGESYALRLLYPVIKSDGSATMAFDNDPAAQLKLTDQPLVVGQEEAPMGSYTFGFMASDISGNVVTEVTTDNL